MSILKKMKDILFEEEEIVIQKPEPKKEVEVTRDTPKEKIVNEAPIVEKITPQVKEKVSEDTKELPSPFIDFDEDEFENNLPFIPREPVKTQVPTRSKPVYNEYERKIKVEKKVDYGRYEKIETTEIKEKKKFKPSLIISPVYGVLNEDYLPEDIKTSVYDTEKLDIDEVRKKAYGELEELEKTIDEPIKTFYEEKTTVSLRTPYESEEKVKTIDELLSISADEKIEVASEVEEEYDFDLTEKIDINEVKKNKKEVSIEEDTLENDLFDLIDSMYENKEEVI